MKDKGLNLIIGLLGKDDEEDQYGEMDSLLDACPLATKDADINKGNQKKAMIMAKYPSTEKGLCKNCEYFNTEMSDCGVPEGKGYCEKFEFVCGANKGCMKFEPMEMEED